MMRTLFLSLFVFTISLAANAAEKGNTPPGNIILYIGDGMGVSQVTAGEIASKKFNLDRFSNIGLLTTHSMDKLITDSAAGATAMSTGFKTNNKMISFTPDGKALKTVFEHAKEHGWSTGAVATCSITHATPACFLAHVDSRSKNTEIADQIAAADIDVLIGGGWTYFIPQTEENSKRTDDKNPLAEMEGKMTVVKSVAEFRATKDVKRLAAFLAPKDLPKATEREVSLAELTSKALAILSKNEQGFILMVEGSQIDWAGHDNNLEYLVPEVLDFDAAVGVGLDFAEENAETLVLVTADHETGGFAIHGGSIAENVVSEAGFTTGGHTGAMVLVFSKGPGEDFFDGIQDNTIIGKKLIDFVKAK